MLNFSTVIIVHVSKKFVSYFFSIVSWLCSHILNFLRKYFFKKSPSCSRSNFVFRGFLPHDFLKATVALQERKHTRFQKQELLSFKIVLKLSAFPVKLGKLIAP